MELVGLKDMVLVIAGVAASLGVSVWGTFAMIHADEARSRKREEALKKSTSTDG